MGKWRFHIEQKAPQRNTPIEQCLACSSRKWSSTNTVRNVRYQCLWHQPSFRGIFRTKKKPGLCHLQHSSALSTGIRKAQSLASAAPKISFVTVRKLNNNPLFTLWRTPTQDSVIFHNRAGNRVRLDWKTTRDLVALWLAFTYEDWKAQHKFYKRKHSWKAQFRNESGPYWF